MKKIFNFSFLFLALGLLVVSCKNKPAGDNAKVGTASETTATAPAAAKTFSVNTTNSKILWVGSKPTGSHNGTINISAGELGVADGQLVSGKFTMDMTSITNLDLKPGEGKEDLEAHLKGTTDKGVDDFFNVTKYPTGQFSITKVEALPAGGEATHNLTGNLTIKGQTKSITFPANIAVVDGKVSAITPSFKINRTDWGINFMSKSVFTDLKDKFINDEIALNIQLEAS